jgi:intracellular sulfur oxidation DsrE/DsrF family protein
MTTRKDFIAGVAAAAASPLPAPAARRPSMKLDFDRAAFEALLAKPARHRQCFGIREIDDGSALAAMNNSIQAYDSFLGEGSGSMHAVGVLYHGPAILFALSDAFWNGVVIPVARKSGNPLSRQIGHLKPHSGNPYLHGSAGEAAVAALTSAGSHFFVCHNAVVGFSQLLAGEMHTTQIAMHERIMSSLVPHSMAVPAGVMAINACQEARFTYVAT